MERTTNRIVLVRANEPVRAAGPSFSFSSPTARTCAVSFTDSEGITHSVEVSASSLYEAAVLALAEFRRTRIATVTPGPGTRLKVEVKAPATSHELSVGKLTAWLEGSGKTPAEQALKTRLRDILA